MMVGRLLDAAPLDGHGLRLCLAIAKSTNQTELAAKNIRGMWSNANWVVWYLRNLLSFT